MSRNRKTNPPTILLISDNTKDLLRVIKRIKELKAIAESPIRGATKRLQLAEMAAEIKAIPPGAFQEAPLADFFRHLHGRR